MILNLVAALIAGAFVTGVSVVLIICIGPLLYIAVVSVALAFAWAICRLSAL